MSSHRPFALLVAVLAVAAPARAQAPELLPDLDQSLPAGLEVAVDRHGAVPRFHLGFDSAVSNQGSGPLIVSAHRSSVSRRLMVADQVVRSGDGSSRRVKRIGSLRYTVSPDHRHWHYLRFDRYELRRASDYELVSPDRKSGFCLGDRYDSGVEGNPAAPREPVFTRRCGLGKPRRLTMREGISPGWGDNYDAILEGQFVDVTGVAAGRYYLVHRANANRKLLESDYDNDAASLLISLSWPHGRSHRPRVAVLRSCPDAEACPAEPVLARPLLDGLALAPSERVVPYR